LDQSRNRLSAVLTNAEAPDADVVRAHSHGSAGSSLPPSSAPAGDSFRDQQWKYPRVRTAAKKKDQTLRQLLGSHGLSYPPEAILLGPSSRKGNWSYGPKIPGNLPPVKKYSICATSGILGPKRRFGDVQVPEGFY